MKFKVELITVGNELLSGKTVDTNSAWISQQFNFLGLYVSRITSVSDSRDEILDILAQSEMRSDIVIITGGLGPTSDDITKPALCEFFNTKLVSRPEILKHIKSLLEKRKHKLNEYNIKQAEVPGLAVPLHNRLGTAPGLWFEKQGTIFISLPGVPFEMKEIFIEKVIPMLRDKFTFPVLIHKTIITQGSFEAQLAEKLKNFESEMPENINIAYLPSPGVIRLRLTATGEKRELIIAEIENQVRKLIKIIPEYVVGFDDDTIELIIGQLLRNNKKTLAVAESCTGGAVSSLITTVPGSSDYFKGGIVAYSNEIKKDQLAVEGYIIDKYGAVSKEVVEKMAENVRLLFNTDYSISVSGISGPSGGSEQKPVGVVWISVSSKNETRSVEYRFGDNRERNIKRTSVTALNILRKLLLDESLIDNIQSN